MKTIYSTIYENLAPNPSLESADGYVAPATGPGIGTITYDTSIKHSGTRSARNIRSTLTPSAVIGYTYVSHPNLSNTYTIPITPGIPYSFGVWMRADRPANFRLTPVWRYSDSTTNSDVGPFVSAAANTWVFVKFENVIPPAGATNTSLRADAQLPSGLSVGGETVWVDDIIAVEGTTCPNFFSGDSSDSIDEFYEWSDTPDASTSLYKRDVLKDVLKESHIVNAVPRLIVEWNYNVHVGTTVTNIPSEENKGYDVDLYPIESLVEGRRPTRGIVKGRVDQAKVSKDFEEKPDAPRYYTVDDNDKYKYWSSPDPGSAGPAAAMPLTAEGETTCKPRVKYGKEIEVNKLVIGFETSWSKPDAWEILLQYVEDGPWNSIGTNFTIPGNGQVVLYYNGTSWGTKVARGTTKKIWGVQVRVTSMDKSKAYLSLIEISARLERNLSRYIISVTDQFTMSDLSFIAPFGQASTNTAEVVLYNDFADDDDPDKGLIFNNDNENSPYKGMIDANVRFTLGYEIDCTSHGGPDDEYVQAFSMWSNIWANQTSGEVNVSLQDSSKFLLEETPHKTMYQHVSVGGVVWRLCDMIGFSRYNVESKDDDPTTMIPVYYTDGETTVWEEFQALAEGTQTAIYFDAYDVLQVKSRRVAYDETRSDWTLRSEPSGNILPDIVEMSQTELYEANHVKVNYQTTEFTDFRNGFPKMETVWSPEETIVLRASPIIRSIEASDEFIWLDPKEARIWPYKGIMNIEGELIRYDGKQYVYYGPNGNRQQATINSEGELRKKKDLCPQAKKHKCHFTGGLKIKTRGLWNTEQKHHDIEASGYNKDVIRGHGVGFGGPGWTHHKKDSNVSITTRQKFTNESVYMATRGQASDGGYYYYGTRIKFDKGSFKHNRGGLVFHVNGANGAGYYLDIRPTDYFGGKERKERNEVVFYSQNGNGDVKRYGGQHVEQKDASKGAKGDDEKKQHAKGVPFSIRRDTWYNIDISIQVQGNGDHDIQIFVDGNYLMNPVVPNGGGFKQPWGGKFGIFARGHSRVFFEFLYAVGRDEGHHPDSIQFFDRVNGGYISDQWMREWVFRTRKEDHRPKGSSDKEKEKYRGMFMDEFGPIAHEVREFEVKFEPAPVLHSRLYASNDWSVVCPEYRSNSFGASFILANVVRNNAVVNGSDSLSFAGQGDIEQSLLVYGRALVIKDAEVVKAVNDNAIRKRGRVETEITSKWIQTKEEAQRLADWIEEHWSGGNDEAQVTVFGNPLIEIGDVVKVEYPLQDYFADTHKYFVVGTATDFTAGLETTLTLRRCKLT